MTDSIEEFLADDVKVEEQARANVAALLAELTERGCEEPFAYLDHGNADDERPGCMCFPFECPQGYEGDLVMPGVPLALVKEADADGRWALLHNGVPYAWADLVAELASFDAARRTIWSNRDLLVDELIARGLPIRPDDVTADADASGDTWVTHIIAVDGHQIPVSVPGTTVGPGLSQEMYVEGCPHAWEAALEAIFAAAGRTMLNPRGSGPRTSPRSSSS
ncbi:hypothetical protein [Streptomyces sp. NPDC101150]|uniref:hypothetical protein n=1 Tax=Streptomyces sp. NPDC101150 TaxID=3366114 RepID=UPI00381D422F